jgi:hypothetical protein
MAEFYSQNLRDEDDVVDAKRETLSYAEMSSKRAEVRPTC